MKKTIIIVAMLFLAIGAKAQLIVNMDNKVSMGTESESFEPMLMVGNHYYFEGNNNKKIGDGSR